jgi:outer membrane lipoprotein-sorting protein
VPVEMSYSSYKEQNGVRFPSVITQKAAGQEFTITIENVRVNVDIPLEKFALPDEVRAILDKAK